MLHVKLPWHICSQWGLIYNWYILQIDAGQTVSLSLLTRIIVSTLPKPHPAKPSYAGWCHTVAQPGEWTVQCNSVHWDSESLPPIDWEGLNITYNNFNEKISNFLEESGLPPWVFWQSTSCACSTTSCCMLNTDCVVLSKLYIIFKLAKGSSNEWAWNDFYKCMRPVHSFIPHN